MKNAPALASRKASKHSSRNHGVMMMNKDLMSSKDGRNVDGGTIVGKKMVDANGKPIVSFLYTASETASRNDIKREISTKLQVIQPRNDQSPTLPSEPNIINQQDQGGNQSPQKKKKSKRLESVLADVIHETIHDKPPTMDPNTPQNLDQLKTSNLLQGPGPGPAKESNHVRKGSFEPTAIMKDIALNIRNTKKSVQYEVGKGTMLLDAEAKAFLASPKNNHQQSSQHMMLGFSVNNNSQPNTTTLQNPAMLSNQSNQPNDDQQIVQVSGDCINLETSGKQFNSMTKLQQQVLKNSVIMSSATALYNAAKIQRIQIVNKPGPQPPTRVSGVESSVLKPQKQDSKTTTTSLMPIGKAIGHSPSPFRRDNSVKKGSIATRDLRKNSTPAGSSSQQSPMQASVSSYLKFQRFSRELGPTPKQLPPGATTNVGLQMMASYYSAKSNAHSKKSPPKKQTTKKSKDLSPTVLTSAKHSLDLNNTTTERGLLILKQDNSQLEVVSNQVHERQKTEDSPQKEKSPGLPPSRNNSQGTFYNLLLASNTNGGGGSPSRREQQNALHLQKVLSNKKDMPLTYQAVISSDATKSQQSGQKQRRRKTLAEILDNPPSQFDPENNKDSFDKTQYRMPGHSTHSTKNTQLSNLPKLQFVVKYADRCRHESTKRHQGIDLQGNQTHILPLNLANQNSLYFVKDQELSKLYEESVLETNQSTKSIVRPEDHTTEVASAPAPPEQLQKSANEFMKITTEKQTTKGTKSDQRVSRLEHSTEYDPTRANLAWIRQQRRTMGYIRTTRLPFDNVKAAAARKIKGKRKHVASNWEGLSKRMLLERDKIDFENETGCKILPSLKENDPNETTTGENFFGENASSQNFTNSAYDGNPASSNSKNRVSSTATYQQYIMAPKIPSSSGANQTESNFLASTQQQVKPSSVNGDDVTDGDTAPDSRTGPPKKGKNFVYIAPPRTSQLERRKRVMKVDTAKVATSAGDSSIDVDRNDPMMNHPGGANKPSLVFNQTSYVATSFGFGSKDDFGSRRGLVSSSGGQIDTVSKDALTQSSLLGFGPGLSSTILSPKSKQSTSQQSQSFVFRIEAPGRSHRLIKQKGDAAASSFKQGRKRSEDGTFYQEYVVNEKPAIVKVDNDRKECKEDSSQKGGPMSKKALLSTEIIKRPGMKAPSKSVPRQQHNHLSGNIGPMFGLTKQCRQSLLMNSRLQKLIQSSHSPLHHLSVATDHEQQQNPTLLKSTSLSGRSHDIGVIFYQDLAGLKQVSSHDGSPSSRNNNQMNLSDSLTGPQLAQTQPQHALTGKNVSSTWRKKATKNDSKGHSPQNHQVLDPLGYPFKRKGTKHLDPANGYKGSIQVKRNGEVLQNMSRTNLGTPPHQKIFLMANSQQLSSTVQASRGGAENSKAEQQASRNFLNALETFGNSSTMKVRDEFASSPAETSTSQHQKLVVQMQSPSADAMPSVKEVPSLDALTKDPTFDGAGTSDSRLQSRGETAMVMTQATPSQFELEDLPNLHELSQQQIIPQVMATDGVPSTSGIPGNAMINWRLNNDSVQNEDKEKEIANQLIIREQNTFLPGQSIQSQNSSTSARMPPGISEILPKELVKELLESQGKQRLDQWLKRRQAYEYDVVSPRSIDRHSIRSTETSPTRDYLERKFNSQKRRREISFYQKALLLKQLPKDSMLPMPQIQQSTGFPVLNYEGASKHYKFEGVNVLTGATRRAPKNL